MKSLLFLFGDIFNNIFSLASQYITQVIYSNSAYRQVVSETVYEAAADIMLVYK